MSDTSIVCGPSPHHQQMVVKGVAVGCVDKGSSGAGLTGGQGGEWPTKVGKGWGGGVFREVAWPPLVVRLV